MSTELVDAPPADLARRQGARVFALDGSEISVPISPEPEPALTVTSTFHIGVTLFTGVLAFALTGINDTVAGVVLGVHLTFGVGLPLAASLWRSPLFAAETWVQSLPVGFAMSSVAAQVLIWTDTYRVSSFILATTMLAVIMHLLVASGRETVPVVGANRAGVDRWTVVAAVLAVAATTLAFVSLGSVEASDLDALGILRALPLLYWVACALAIGVTWLLLTPTRRGAWWLIPATWLAVAHGAILAMHPHPRFPTGWVHLGFADYVAERGSGGVNIDARFAWPGLFGALAAPLDLLPAGADEAVMRWWPLGLTALMTILVWEVSEVAFPEVEMVAPIAATVFVLGSWTGQDYLSPQSAGLVFYLFAVLLVERGGFQHGVAQSRRFLGRMVRDGETMSQVDVSSLVPVLLVMVVASVGNHPLSPVYLIVSLGVLALYGRVLAPSTMMLAFAGFVAWFVLSSEPWWSTEIPSMLEDLADPFGNVTASSADRSRDASSDHVTVVATRVLFAGALLGVLAASALVQVRRPALRPRTPLVPLAALSMGVVVLQSYGGELAIRSYLFALPFAAVLVARLLSSHMQRALTVVLVAALLVPFFVARFGNEAFEVATAGDRALVNQAYDLAAADPGRYAFATSDWVMPWRDALVAEVPYFEIEDSSPEFLFAEAQSQAVERGRAEVIVVLTESAATYGVDVLGRPVGWADTFVDGLVQLGAEIEADNGTGYILTMPASGSAS